MYVAKIVIETFHSTAPPLTFSPLQPRRILSLPGGSAAKVFEACSHQTSIKAGRVLRRPPGKFRVREFGDVGVAFSLVTFLLAKQKKVTRHQAKNTANRKPPNHQGNKQPDSISPTDSHQKTVSDTNQF
jgi:hypothetical protein